MSFAKVKSMHRVRIIIFLFILLNFLSSPKLFCSGNHIIDNLNKYDVKFYFLNLDVDNQSEQIQGSVEILIEIVNPEIDTIIFELIDPAEIDSVLIGNAIAEFHHADDLISIPFESPVSTGDLLSVRIYYKLPENVSDPTNGVTTKLNALEKPVTWSLSEPFYSKYWFPCKQVLADKADSLYLFFTVADSLKVGSNGLLTAITPLPDGRLRYEWKSHYPTAYYLISFAVANYLDYSFYAKTGESDSVLVQNYVYNDSAFFQSNKSQIDATGNLLRVFSECFGPYPFIKEKYGHCIAPIGGGMEHQTMTTLGNFAFNLVSHEMAHQWFGDNVTCQNWQDIWINESFASYAEYIAIEKLKAPQVLKSWLSEAFDLIVMAPGGSVFVPESDSSNSNRIFDYRLSYRKGAYMIHMLRHELGDDELFFNVLRSFQEEYQNSTATTSDFVTVLQSVSQRDFSTFFNQWFYGEGYPILDFYWKQHSDTLSIKTVQETTLPSVTPFFNLLIDFKIYFIGGDTLVQFRQSAPDDVFRFLIDKKVYQITPDPDHNLLAEIRTVAQQRDADTVSLFSVFPNPAKNEVYIENFDPGLFFNAKLYDSGGAFIKETESSGAFGRFDISELAPGVYQIVVWRNKYNEVFKIAKL